MDDSFIMPVAIAGALAGAYKVWEVSLDAREAANRIAKDTCSRAVVQFLDGTVAFAGFRLSRDSRGKRRLLRTYTFDYTNDGFERAQGFIVLAGNRLEAVGVAEHPIVGGLNIDLHTHSNCSDGSLSPAALIERAAAAGVQVLALTDHDTVQGLIGAARSRRAGPKIGPGRRDLGGVAFTGDSCAGFWIDPASADLRGVLHEQGALRRLRMRKICERLEKLRLPGAELLATVERNPGLPTRAHLAAAMVAGGLVDTHDTAFRKYLNKGKAAHIAAAWPALEAVVGWIRAAGGVASLAHPARYALSAGARRHLLADFAAAGGTALEVVTGGNGAQHVDACAALAVKHGLFGSVGSDFHNPQAAWNPFGRSLKLPDCVTPVWRSFGLQT